MAMMTGGGDSGVETENESNDIDIVNVNVINDQGDPILDLPDSGPSSSESDLNQHLGAGSSTYLGPDSGPSILLGIKDKGDDPPPPPPPTSPNICGTGGSEPDFLDVASAVQNFSCDSLDGMIDETEVTGVRQNEVIESMQSILSPQQSSSLHTSVPVNEDEIMERDDPSGDEAETATRPIAINHERPHNNGEYASPSKRFLSDIPEPDFADCKSYYQIMVSSSKSSNNKLFWLE